MFKHLAHMEYKLSMCTKRCSLAVYETPVAVYETLVVSKARRKRESKNTKQETKRFSIFAVYRLRHSEAKETLLDSRIMF